MRIFADARNKGIRTVSHATNRTRHVLTERVRGDNWRGILGWDPASSSEEGRVSLNWGYADNQHLRESDGPGGERTQRSVDLRSRDICNFGELNCSNGL